MDVCKPLFGFHHCPCSIAQAWDKQHNIECAHPVTRDGMCLRCAKVLDSSSSSFSSSSLPPKYPCPSFRLSKDHEDRIREMRTKAMLGLKKLHLVLDLDNTLVHSVRVSRLTPEEEHLVAEANRNTRSTVQGEGNFDLFLLGGKNVKLITKLRPFVREFLREACKMFELSIYTMGSRSYASRVAKLLDPDGCYFASRISSQEDCTVKGRKSLDMILVKESNILIVDDTKEVWPDHKDNLLVIKPFFFFSHRSQKQKQLMGERGSSPNDDENDRDEALSIMLRDLSEIHSCYFEFEKKLGAEART